MADEVQRLAGSLSDLNKVAITSGIEFKGLTKRLTEAATGIGAASKRWTIFSRLVSGTPLWKLQNYFRGLLGILGEFESSSKAASEAQRAANDRVIEQIQSYSKIQPQLAALNKLQEESHNRTRLDVKMRSESNKELKEALEGTLAYNKAILEGNSANQAYKKGLEELIIKGEEQTKMFKAAQKEAQFRAKLETSGGRAELKAAQKAKLGAERGATTGKLFSRVGDDLKSIGERFKNQEKIRDRFNKATIKFYSGVFKFQEIAKPVINYLFRVLVLVMLGMLALIVVGKFLADAYEILEELGVLQDLKNIFNEIKPIIAELFSAVVSFFGGDFGEALTKIEGIISPVLGILFDLLKVSLKVGFGLLVAAFYTGLDTVKRFLTEPEFRESVLSMLKIFAKVFLALYVVKQLALQALLIASIYALPLLIGVVILAGLAAIVKALTDKIPFMANGGISKGGLTVVGEKGPELVNLPTGARVNSNRESRKMVGGTTNNINITINARDTSDQELRRIADKIGQMVNTKINRTTSSRTFGG